MIRLLLPFLLLVQSLVALPARAVETPIPPSPTRWVTDNAGFLPEPARRALDAELQAYERQTGHQIIVWIGQTTGGVPIEDWAVRAFAKWRVGRKGLDDGIALIIMAEDRRIRIEVGYGLEPKVPDITASRIINEVMTPRIRAGDRGGAVQGAIQALTASIEGKPWAPGLASAPRPPPPGRGGSGIGVVQTIVFAFFGLIFLVILITHPSLALYLLYVLMSGGGRGGGGGGYGGGGDGGGFSGGGGRSGGGGASGSW